MDTKYNGWCNYETWNVALWLDNDGAGEYFRERANDLFEATDEDDTLEERKLSVVGQLADEIKDQHEENMPTVAGTYADLLGAALGAVDWHEFAEHYTDDLEVTAPEADDAGVQP